MSRKLASDPMYWPQFGQNVCATSAAGKHHGTSCLSSIRNRVVGVSHASPRTHTLIAALRTPSPRAGSASCTESGSGRPAPSTFDQNRALPATCGAPRNSARAVNPKLVSVRCTYGTWVLRASCPAPPARTARRLLWCACRAEAPTHGAHVSTTCTPAWPRSLRDR